MQKHYVVSRVLLLIIDYILKETRNEIDTYTCIRVSTIHTTVCMSDSPMCTFQIQGSPRVHQLSYRPCVVVVVVVVVFY